MKKTGLLIVVLCAVVITALSTFVWAEDRLSKLEGWKPYTPSRLQWLAVELNADLRVPLSEATKYLMAFVPIEKEDTILIQVRYIPSVNREVMNMALSTAREVISIKVKGYGWDLWLRVKEDVQMTKLE